MDPHANPSPEHRPLGSESASLPPLGATLRAIDDLIFILERSDLRSSLTNILSAAALYRAITLERGTTPRLTVVGEVALSNSLNGYGKVDCLTAPEAGKVALLVTAASFYRKELSQILGSYVLAGGSLEGTLNSVDDSVPLGKRDDPHEPIRRYVSARVRECSDPWVQRLLALAELSEGETDDKTISAIHGALTTLHRESFPFLRNRKMNMPDIFSTVREMIGEWSQGIEVPTSLQRLMERTEESTVIARSIWSSAVEIAQGVFQLEEIPYDERDVVIDGLVKDLYSKDPRARFVLERGFDRSATGLSYSEAIEFERRLGVGEDPEALLEEVSGILQRRGDTSSLIDISIAEMREREARGTLERILERSQYLPDPDGKKFTILKHPSDLKLYHALQNAQFPLITHSSLWICNLKTGDAEPVVVQFQGQYLSRFFDLLEISHSE